MSLFDLTPMEPLPWSSPFDDDSFVFQLKWDGVRMLTAIQDGIVALINRKGASRTAQYPELHDLVSVLPTGTVLDGELVVLVENKPSFTSIIKRDMSRQPGVVKARAALFPVSYVVFDMLYLRGEDVRSQPLERRQETIVTLLGEKHPYAHPVENFPSGKQLFTVVEQYGLEGIVAKRRHSPYIPGKKSDHWRKIKNFRHICCAVGGYTLRDGQPSALILGMFGEAGLVYVGRAGSGLGAKEWAAIGGFLQMAEVAQTPFLNPPTSQARTTIWVLPKLAVRVKFMEWSPDLKLRAPVIEGFEAASPERCSFQAQGV